MEFSDDDETAYVTQREFDDLPEYSCSYPTGTTVGKRWKRDNNWPGLRGHDPKKGPDWCLGEYYLDETIPAGRIGIRWRYLVVGENPKRDAFRHSNLWC